MYISPSLSCLLVNWFIPMFRTNVYYMVTTLHWFKLHKDFICFEIVRFTRKLFLKSTWINSFLILYYLQSWQLSFIPNHIKVETPQNFDCYQQVTVVHSLKIIQFSCIPLACIVPFQILIKIFTVLIYWKSKQFVPTLYF